LTSDRRRRANRVNAKSSTGPKTAAGKTRAAQNGLRHHGLNVSVLADLALAPEVETMARKIAGPDADVESLEHARRISEAQVDLNRVRACRRRVLVREIDNPDYQPLRVLKLEALLLAKPDRIGRGLGRPFVFEGSEEIASPIPLEGEQKLGMILEDKARELATLDRYEGRALSRRKFAIRDFDAARARAAARPRPREN